MSERTTLYFDYSKTNKTSYEIYDHIDNVYGDRIESTEEIRDSLGYLKSIKVVLKD